MEPPRPSSINTDDPNLMILAPNLEGMTLEGWTEDKLDKISSEGSGYDEVTEDEISPRWRDNSHQQISEKNSTAGNELPKPSSASHEITIDLQLPAEISSSAGTAVKQETENSSFTVEDAEVPESGDSDHQERLSTPVWPQNSNKAKVIYIPNRSPKTVAKSGNENFSINSKPTVVGGDSKSYTPPLPTPQINKSHNQGNPYLNNSAFVRPRGEPESITNTNYQHKLPSVSFKEVEIPSRGSNSTNETLPGISYSRLQGVQAGTPNNGIPKRFHIANGDLVSEPPEINTTHTSFEERRRAVKARYYRDRPGTYYTDNILAANHEYPPNMSRDRPRHLQPPEDWTPTYNRSTRAPSPSSLYSVNSENIYNDQDTSGAAQSRTGFPKAYPDYNSSNLHGSIPHSYHPENTTTKLGQPRYQNEGRNVYQVIRKPIIQSKDYSVGNSHRLKSGGDLDEEDMNQGTRKTVPSFSPNPSQSTSFMVTREIFQEEERDVLGRFNHPTFAAHIPPFGKDPMEEIQKIHAKGDNKPAFLKSIRGVVHDGMNRTWKNPIKSRGRPSDKMVISAPMHNGNPLQLSGSSSTPDILLTARPIPGTEPIKRSPFTIEEEVSGYPKLKQPAKEVPSPGPLPLELDDVSEGADKQLEGNGHASRTREKDFESAMRKATLNPDSPTISIGPFQQSGLYSYIECSVVHACSDFLKTQQMSLNVNLLKKEVKRWRRQEVRLSDGTSKKRERPVEFMFGLEVQCRLLEGNHKTLTFSGPAKMNPLPTLATWKQMIPAFSPRTFCFPDYVVLDHLRMVERIFHLLGEGYWNKTLFEKKHSEIISYILSAGETRKEKRAEENMTKLQSQRVNAESELLKEVGILSSEEIQTTIEKTGTTDI